MFEKESKEYANKWLEHVKDLELQHKTDDKPEYIRIEEAHQKGVEFGYKKANEWHYVKDGDLPKDKTEKIYLVALKSDYGGFFYETEIWCESLHCFASNNPTKIYAWKEIVLPELKESE